MRLVAARTPVTVTHDDEGSRPPPVFDEPPVPIKIFTPDYPDEARQGKIGGVVSVEVTVSETGRVVRAEVVQSDTVPVLEAAAVRAALISLFRPALQNGEPIESRVTLPFRFKPN
jgi:protein TonB